MLGRALSSLIATDYVLVVLEVGGEGTYVWLGWCTENRLAFTQRSENGIFLGSHRLTGGIVKLTEKKHQRSE